MSSSQNTIVEKSGKALAGAGVLYLFIALPFELMFYRGGLVILNYDLTLVQTLLVTIFMGLLMIVIGLGEAGVMDKPSQP